MAEVLDIDSRLTRGSKIVQLFVNFTQSSYYMSCGFHQAKLNRSVVKDLRKQTLAQFGANGFRLGETTFVNPANISEVTKPRELVGKIVGRDKIYKLS